MKHVAAHDYQLFDSSYCPTKSSRDKSKPAADVQHCYQWHLCQRRLFFFFSAKTVSFQFTTRNKNNLQAKRIHANDRKWEVWLIMSCVKHKEPPRVSLAQLRPSLDHKTSKQPLIISFKAQWPQESGSFYDLTHLFIATKCNCLEIDRWLFSQQTVKYWCFRLAAQVRRQPNVLVFDDVFLYSCCKHCGRFS